MISAKLKDREFTVHKLVLAGDSKESLGLERLSLLHCQNLKRKSIPHPFIFKHKTINLGLVVTGYLRKIVVLLDKPHSDI